MSENQQLLFVADPVKKEVQSSASINVWLALSSMVPVKDQLAATIDKEISEEEKMHVPLKIFDGKKASISDLNQASSSYLWLRRIKEIFLVFGTNAENDPLVIHDTNCARKEIMETTNIFLENSKPVQRTNNQVIEQNKQKKWEEEKSAVHNFQQKFYRRNANSKTGVIVIDPETNRSMHYSNSIWWYSWNEAFIYRQINNILRMENFELLMSYRYFISDLCHMIKEYYDEQSEQRPKMVYRAEWIDRNQLETLKKASTKQGQLISMNGFISTTTDQTISNFYANKSCTRPNVVSVVYEITIDSSRSCTEFACIEHISYHPEEKEVLFNIGAVFSVDSIHDPIEPNHFYTIKVTACEYNESLIDDMKLKLRKYTQPELYILLTKYLIELEQYRTVRKSLINLLDNSHVFIKHESSLASAYNCIGEIYFRQEFFGDAILYYKQALNYQIRFDSSNNNALAECYYNIGSVLLEQKYFYEALENLQEALRIQNREPINKKHLIKIYTNLARIYASINKYDQAINYFDKTKELISQDKNKIAYDALEKRLIEADANFHAISFQRKQQITSNPWNFLEIDQLSARYDQVREIYENILPFGHRKLIKIIKYLIITTYHFTTIFISNDSFKNLINLQPISNHKDKLEILNLLGCYFVNKTIFENKNYYLAIKYWKKIIRPIIDFHDDNNNDTINNFIYECYNIALEYFKDNQQIPENIFNLGIIFALKGDVDNAILYLTQTKLTNKNDLLICSILLGNLYSLEKNFLNSTEYYSRALTFIDDDNDNDQYMKIELYLALANSDKNNCLQILEKLEKNMEEFSNDLDDDIIKLRSNIYEKISYELIKIKQYDKAFNYVNKAKNLKLKYLSNNHPDLAKTYILIGKFFQDKQQYRQALEQYEEASAIQHVNLSPDHIEIIKLKLEILYLHYQMKKIDKLPREFDEKTKLYIHSTYQGLISATQLYHGISVFIENKSEYQDAHDYEDQSITLQRYQWPEVLFKELLINSNIENLKELLPTSKIHLKNILQNFYYILTQCDMLKQRIYINDNSIFDFMKNSKEKIRNLKSLLFSLWSNEEKEYYINNIDNNLDKENERQLYYHRKNFIDDIEDKIKEFINNYKISISFNILEEKNEIIQYILLFIYDLFEYYNLNNDDEDIKYYLIKCIYYGKDFIRVNNFIDAAKLSIISLDLYEYFFKHKNPSFNNKDNQNNIMINYFIDDLRKFLTNDFNPIINMLNNNLCYYLPDDIKKRNDFQVWLLLKRAILNKQHNEPDVAFKLYGDCIDLIKQMKIPLSSLQIAAIQYSMHTIHKSSDITISDDLSSIDSLLLTIKLNKQPDFHKTNLALNISFECDKEQIKYIGQYLFHIGDYKEAISYWKSILELQNEFISKLMNNIIFSSTKIIQQIYDEMKRINNDFIQQLHLLGVAYIRCAFLVSKFIDTLLPAEYHSSMVEFYYEEFFSKYINYAKAISISINGDNNDEINNQCQTLIMETKNKIETAYPDFFNNSK